MVFRRKGPGIVGRTAQTVARTAVITATASAVANKMARSGPGAAPAEPSAAAAGLSHDDIARLEKLAALNKSGVLSDEELAAEKAKILG